MINTKELRLGNWVKASYGNIQIDSINSEGVDLVPNWDGCEMVITKASEIDPIPLTPELLLKCGFIEDSAPNLYWKGDIAVFTKGGGLDHPYVSLGWKGGVIPVPHLHQLQNLYFALTGEELAISQ